MIELKDNLNFHNFNLDCKPESWFKRKVTETPGEWLKRVARQGEDMEYLKWRSNNRYWTDSSVQISLSICKFLAKSNMTKEILEDLVGFELDLKGSHDWKLSELKKIELYTNIKL